MILHDSQYIQTTLILFKQAYESDPRNERPTPQVILNWMSRKKCNGKLKEITQPTQYFDVWISHLWKFLQIYVKCYVWKHPSLTWRDCLWWNSHCYVCISIYRDTLRCCRRNCPHNFASHVTFILLSSAPPFTWHFSMEPMDSILPWRKVDSITA